MVAVWLDIFWPIFKYIIYFVPLFVVLGLTLFFKLIFQSKDMENRLTDLIWMRRGRKFPIK